jgi:ankyrin repeat protein
MSDKTRCLSNIVNKKPYVKIKRLLDMGADANYTNTNSTSLLSYTAEYRKPKIGAFFIEYSTDVDAADNDEYKRTPLHWAARSDCSPTIKNY